MKIGILTQFFRSRNYGGLLQAYALVTFLNEKGFDAEQICYIPNSISFSSDSSSNSKNAALKLTRCVYALVRKIENKRIGSKIEKRNNRIDNFADIIPHSVEIYTKDTIKQANSIYDGFVAGSDQIWNPRSIDSTYFLDFADDNKKKVAYAASICKNNLTKEEGAFFKHELKNLDAISLRESNINLLEELTDKSIETVLDPTMLLGKEKWDNLASERLIKEDYVLCYFLGHDKRTRKIAKEYAKQRKLPLVTMPHLAVKVEVYDIGFGDQQLIDVSPQEFLSLIKYAKCILTDSFHATVFSNIFQKDFFVFERVKEKGMTSRIDTLLNLYNKRDRYCDTNTTVFDLLKRDTDSNNGTKSQNLLEQTRQFSIDYLLSNLATNYMRESQELQ